MKTKKYFSRYKEPIVQFPDFVETQLKSYRLLIDEGIGEVFREFSPVVDYSQKKFDLEFVSFELGKPKYDEYYAKDNKITYEASLRAVVRLKNKTLNTSKEQEIFMADFPMMTPHGTFIINGVERVIVPQLARSFGVSFSVQELKGKRYFGAKIIPSRGAWVELESEPDGVIYVRIDKKRKFPVTFLLRVLGMKDDKEIIAAFADPAARAQIEATLEKDTAKTVENSYVEIHKRLRDGELVTPDNAKGFIDSIFSKERYDLSEVGRFKFNKRFGRKSDKSVLTNERTISRDDVVAIVAHIAKLNITPGAAPDDIDHLGSRRVRSVGELLHQKLRVGMSQIKRNVQDRMSTIESDTVLPIQFISPRPLQARIKEFFATNQLSQFMGQYNILNEIEHLRTLSALGPGGLTRERAGLEVRDVHSSHYGRLCPIHTPEGPNIGLILRFATYAWVNDFGIIETPYVKVEKGKITGEVVYLDALEEEQYIIAHAATHYDASGNISEPYVEARSKTSPLLVGRDEVQLMDVAPGQAFSIATSMIPFLEHNDANRALMGSNMQKQATPAILPQAPLVATGMEAKAARDTGRIILAPEDGTIEAVDAKKVVLKGNKETRHTYDLVNYSRTNSFTALHQRPAVSLGQKVKKGDLLVDTSSSDGGQIALGQNMLVAFMSWGGSNYEDAIILSEKVVKDGRFTSIYMDEFTANVRDTKLGPEITTHDIPNVGEAKLKDLDEDGIVRIGAEVQPGDILVGKITPKGEAELTPEERLLRSIFGEKARDVKDTSLRMPHGKRGRIVGVKVFSRDRGDNLESGIIKKIHVEIAQLRNVTVGDKLAGRHGNKGVVSTVLAEEDMPFMEDGRPVDVILTPLGVPSRMNLGQILELHLGLAAHTLDYQAIVPAFMGATVEEIKEELEKAGFSADGKMKLFDGRTGQTFEQNIAVGYMYILKLHHMVEDKIHMRSIGPYSLITQQPLGGKAQVGGQRFGEMEVWALEGYGAAHILREMLTIKSDDIVGRSRAFDAIVQGEKIHESNTPESFNVLLYNLRGLSLDVILQKHDEDTRTK